DGAAEALGGQAALPVGGVAGLGAGRLARGRLDDGLGRLRRIGRGRDRGVGGVGAEARQGLAELRLQVADALLQGGRALLQRTNPRIALQTSRTGYQSPTLSIAALPSGSCATFSGERLPHFIRPNCRAICPSTFSTCPRVNCQASWANFNSNRCSSRYVP